MSSFVLQSAAGSLHFKRLAHKTSVCRKDDTGQACLGCVTPVHVTALAGGPVHGALLWGSRWLCMCAGGDSDASADSTPEMRYASDESDTSEEAPLAAKVKARKARKAKAGSDEGEDDTPVVRRSKSRRKAAEEVCSLFQKGQEGS